jgi:hypothetical protein
VDLISGKISIFLTLTRHYGHLKNDLSVKPKAQGKYPSFLSVISGLGMKKLLGGAL